MARPYAPGRERGGRLAEAGLPTLLVGNVITLMPAPLLARATALVMRRLGRAHPRLFRALAEHPPCAVGIVPTDLRHRFVLRFGGAPPSLRPLTGAMGPVDACVKGSLAALLALLESRADGDALFFSRDIVITGDTAAVVTLRNLLERDAVDVFATAAGLFGPFDGLVRRAAGALDRRLLSARRHLAAIHTDLHGDMRDDRVLAMRAERLDADVRALSARVARLEARNRRHSPPSEPAVDMT